MGCPRWKYIWYRWIWAYSTGEVYLEEGEILYIYVGGQPDTIDEGGYNGGGAGYIDTSSLVYLSAGGGATHIALVDGLLSTLEDNLDNILIIASGGGAGAQYYLSITGGNGGGIYGGSPYYNENNVTTLVKSLNIGAYQYASINEVSNFADDIPSYSTLEQISVRNGCFGLASLGGGGGFYGGDYWAVNCQMYSGAGGSGYIGNSNLTNKSMYCYDCTESTDEDTYTVSTTNVSSEALSYYAKEGSGYARITYLGK